MSHWPRGGFCYDLRFVHRKLKLFTFSVANVEIEAFRYSMWYELPLIEFVSQISDRIETREKAKNLCLDLDHEHELKTGRMLASVPSSIEWNNHKDTNAQLWFVYWICGLANNKPRFILMHPVSPACIYVRKRWFVDRLWRTEGLHYWLYEK